MSRANEALRLHETAADWYFRRQEPGWTDSDEAEFQGWLRADARHSEAMEALAQTWLDFAGVVRPALESDAVVSSGPARTATATVSVHSTAAAEHAVAPAGAATAPMHRSASRSSESRSRWFSRWGGLRLSGALAAICLLVMAGGWLIYDNYPTYRVNIATTHGESRTLDLPDGSHIAVNMDTQLSVRLYPRRREVQLTRGEAWFQVAHAPERPFIVSAGDSQVRVTGTVFDVLSQPGRMRVQVREGRVEVRGPGACGTAPVLLQANQAVNVSDPCTSRLSTYPVSADRVGDWREGQLVFRRTPLEEVAQDLSRYLGKPVHITSQQARALPVSGFAATAQPQAFLESLSDLLPVLVSQEADGYRIDARP